MFGLYIEPPQSQERSNTSKKAKPFMGKRSTFIYYSSFAGYFGFVSDAISNDKL